MREQVARIFLRYLAIWLVAQGWFSSEDGSMFASDPDVAMFIDMGVGFAAGGAPLGGVEFDDHGRSGLRAERQGGDQQAE